MIKTLDLNVKTQKRSQRMSKNCLKNVKTQMNSDVKMLNSKYVEQQTNVEITSHNTSQIMSHKTSHTFLYLTYVYIN